MRKVLFLLLFLLVLGAVGTNAQVRIGGDGEPHTAAVLDLNVDNSDDGNNGGLALPRVELINNTTQLNGTAPTKGMLVYNTNPDMANGQGTGVYYWDGSKWMVAASEVGAFGPTVAGAVASYKTWCFPAYTKLGCWTIDNSSEGPNSATTYTGQYIGALGYYYTDAQKAGACTPITGYVLPNQTQWTALMNYINGPNSSAIERQHWLFGSALAGQYDTATKVWTMWGVRGYWWSSSAAGQVFISQRGAINSYNNTTRWYTVRCVKS